MKRENGTSNSAFSLIFNVTKNLKLYPIDN
nr:MAG TPA: hypothetical protein [Caudoviricetes sp.]